MIPFADWVKRATTERRMKTKSQSLNGVCSDRLGKLYRCSNYKCGRSWHAGCIRICGRAPPARNGEGRNVSLAMDHLNPSSIGAFWLCPFCKPHLDYCYICDETMEKALQSTTIKGALVCCSTCTTSWHEQCGLQRGLSPWEKQCSMCKRQNSSQTSTRRAKQAVVEDGKLTSEPSKIKRSELNGIDDVVELNCPTPSTGASWHGSTRKPPTLDSDERRVLTSGKGTRSTGWTDSDDIPLSGVDMVGTAMTESRSTEAISVVSHHFIPKELPANMPSTTSRLARLREKRKQRLHGLT